MATNLRITLDQWRAFLAVVDAGGYAQAAAALHKSQSTVSYAVRKIESLLGVKVFEIKGRKAVLTEAGRVLHRRAQTLVEEAATLGMPVGRVRLIVVAAATLGTAAVVAVSGLIGFVGLIVPHTVRLMVGGSYRSVLPLSALFGASFLILVDTLARTVVAPAEIPIGVITAFIGAPFFIAVLRRNRRTA